MIDEKKLIKTLQDRIDVFVKQHPDQKNCEQVQVQREFIHEIELAAAENNDYGWIPISESVPDSESMSSGYWHYEDDENIICPYCGEEYEPSYEDTYIGDDCVDCYTEDTNTYTCDKCGKKFTMYGYQAGWKYRTETIDGEATEEEVENLQN